MVIIAVFVVLVFFYSLVSRRLEHTVITAPIVFTSTGMLLILAISGLHELSMTRESFRELAEIGLVMLSIFAHGFSALPGIDLYTRKIATLDATSSETRQ